MKEPLGHLPDCNFYSYSLQLNLYAYILSTEYGMPVNSMLLGIVHPDRDKGQLLSVSCLRDEVESIVEHERTLGRAREVRAGDSLRFL